MAMTAFKVSQIKSYINTQLTYLFMNFSGKHNQSEPMVNIFNKQPERTRYETDFRMVKTFLAEMLLERQRVLATENEPNKLLEEIDWHMLTTIQEKLKKLKEIENHEDLNRQDAKLKKLNQRYKKTAVR